MTKKMLQGMATGIFITTTIFAYNYYFTNDVIKEVDIEENSNLSEDMIQEYLEEHDLIAINKEEYEKLLTEREENSSNHNKEEITKENKEIKEEVIAVKQILFIIDPGTSSGTVGSLLEREGLIKDKQQFKSYLINNGLETKIKAGEYQLSTDMSLAEIVEKLS